MWICVFTTCSTTFVPCDTHLDLCNVCIHEFVSMYVRTSMYVCMYVCMHVTYVCIAVYMYVYNQWRTKGVVWGFPPPPRNSEDTGGSSIACARRTGASISFCSSLCSRTVVIY